MAVRAGLRNFHDLLKARMLHVRQTLQILRRTTWDEATTPPPGRSRQDEVSCAWNLWCRSEAVPVQIYPSRLADSM
jgi:hypothetical protein